jgi:GDP-L-fucose synthase
VGAEVKITHDLTKPDGTARKRLNIEKLRALGWSAQIGLEDGIADAYRSFLNGNYVERRNGVGEGAGLHATLGKEVLLPRPCHTPQNGMAGL